MPHYYFNNETKPIHWESINYYLARLASIHFPRRDNFQGCNLNYINDLIYTVSVEFTVKYRRSIA